MTGRRLPWPDGYPCWVDLGTSDRDAAREFYRAVMGWRIVDSGAQPSRYDLAVSADGPVAAIGPAPDAGPAAWTIYFATSDVEAAASLVTDCGGSLVRPPGDVGDVGDLGRAAVATDPTGAVFGLWQAIGHPGSATVREPGSMSWHDLMTRDPEAAREFYGNVFDWEFTPIDEDPNEYATVAGDSPSGMICAIGALDPATPFDVAAHWRVYFSVTDVDAAIARVRTGGGRVTVEPADTPYGRMSMVADPQGAAFVLIDHAVTG